MRVIAGKYRGRVINIPKDDRIRPTMDRIKETVFNVIQGYVEGARVLDLFAGTGNLGIEALSRGANEVVFVDNHPDSISLINKNLSKMEGNIKVVKADYSLFLQSQRDPFDVIFIDAPYHCELGPRAVRYVIENDLLEEDGVLCFEHDAKELFKLELPGTYVNKEKVMGNVTFNFIYKVSVGIMTGSFDPFTRGHLAILEGALEHFDKVYVACLVNPEKTYLFTPDERVQIIQKSLLELGKKAKRVEVIFSEKDAAVVYNEMRAKALIRAIRNEKDAAYEKEMEKYNLEHGGAKTMFIDVPEPMKKFSSTECRENIEKGNYDGIVHSAIETIKEIMERK